MFVSILQLMGFPMGKPVHSPAKEVTPGQPSKADIERITSKVSERAVNTKQTSTSEVHTPVNSARRQEVKTQPGKAKVAPKAISAVAKAKAAVKADSKPNAKTAAKPPVKKASPGKMPVKADVKVKGVKVAPKVTVPSAKAAVSKSVKVTAQVQSKDSVKTTTAKAVQPDVVAPKPKVAPSAISDKMVAPVPAPASSVPARAGRPSSRLAQLTVPSMAQSVASTAAKASFTQTMSSPLIIPPLASAMKKDPKLANNWKTKPVEQLTDAELIAMPDDEYMNDFQMAFFRHKLTQLKQDILSNAGETTEHLREETVVVPDPADRATIEEEHALELRTRDRERKLLKKIEQSIVRIDAGDYGYCDETGEPIGVGRLLARPTANLSLEAQQRRELKQKMFGD
jgi:DnaK suppressor protein